MIAAIERVDSVRRDWMRHVTKGMGRATERDARAGACVNQAVPPA